jgi:hypothetical protein
MPLLSKGVTEKWKDAAVDYVDNVLLELILALEFNRLSDKESSVVFPCKFIMPVFVDDVFSILGNLSQDPARETMKEGFKPAESSEPWACASLVITLLTQFSPPLVHFKEWKCTCIMKS